MGPPVPPSAWFGFDDHAKAAMASVALHAAGIPVRSEPWPYRTPDPEAVAAAFAASDAVQARLAKEGLLIGPLDDDQVARVRQIKDEVLVELGPKPNVR